MMFLGQASALRGANQRPTTSSGRCCGRCGGTRDGMVGATNDGYTEGAGDIADRIGNRRSAATGEKQSHGLRRSLRHDERAGISRTAERAAVDKYLIEVKDCELLPLAAVPLILHAHVGVYRTDRRAGQPGGAA